MEKDITRLFKKYIVKRPNGNCQVLFALTELDDLVGDIITVVSGYNNNKCEPSDILLMSNPPKFKCINCRKTWSVDEETPNCKSKI